MTVCLGALAADSMAIVCVADKCITYSQDIYGDTDSVKILPLGENGVHVLIAGADRSIGRVLSKLVVHDDLGRNKEKTKQYCEEAYREAEKEILELKFLSPFVDAREYNEALRQERVNGIIKSISDAIAAERKESTADSIFSCA